MISRVHRYINHILDFNYTCCRRHTSIQRALCLCAGSTFRAAHKPWARNDLRLHTHTHTVYSLVGHVRHSNINYIYLYHRDRWKNTASCTATLSPLYAYPRRPGSPVPTHAQRVYMGTNGVSNIQPRAAD